MARGGLRSPLCCSAAWNAPPPFRAQSGGSSWEPLTHPLSSHVGVTLFGVTSPRDGTVMIIVIYSSVFPVGSEPCGAGLSLVHLWEPRDAPEAASFPWKGSASHACLVQFPTKGPPAAPGRRLLWRNFSGASACIPLLSPGISAFRGTKLGRKWSLLGALVHPPGH